MTEHLIEKKLNSYDNFRHKCIPSFCNNLLICFYPIGA